jgi:hypothetical protein
MISTGLPSVRPQDEILVMYCSSPTTYGIRMNSCVPSALSFRASPPVLSSGFVLEPRTISCTEYDELAALRKAQAWGTPMLQPDHSRYEETIARLRELEAKELVTSERAFSI